MSWAGALHDCSARGCRSPWHGFEIPLRAVGFSAYRSGSIGFRSGQLHPGGDGRQCGTKNPAHLSGSFTAPMTIQNDREFSYAIIDLTDVGAGIAEDQATSGRGNEAATGQGHGGNAVLRGLF
jgi:hypothetical protein